MQVLLEISPAADADMELICYVFPLDSVGDKATVNMSGTCRNSSVSITSPPLAMRAVPLNVTNGTDTDTGAFSDR